MKNPQIIDKIKQLEKEFQTETNCLKKMIIIHKYMEFLKTEKVLKTMFAEENSKTNDTLNSMMTGSATLADFDIQTGKTNIEDNSIFFYTFLDAMYKTMEEYKALTNKKKIDEFKEKVEMAFKSSNQGMVYNMSFTVLNKKVINELSTEDFVKGHKDNIYFDKGKSILHIKGKQIKIKRKADLPLEHYILEYLFEQNDKTEEIYYKDIATEKLNELEYNSSKDWKKYYNAYERLQNKIRVDINIDDFLIYTTNKTGNVKINKRYLKYLG